MGGIWLQAWKWIEIYGQEKSVPKLQNNSGMWLSGNTPWNKVLLQAMYSVIGLTWFLKEDPEPWDIPDRDRADPWRCNGVMEPGPFSWIYLCVWRKTIEVHD